MVEKKMLVYIDSKKPDWKSFLQEMHAESR